MKLSVVFILLLGSVIAAYAEDTLVIYKYIDYKGIVHITSEKPEWWKEEYDNVEDWKTIKPPQESDEQKTETGNDTTGEHTEGEHIEPGTEAGVPPSEEQPKVDESMTEQPAPPPAQEPNPPDESLNPADSGTQPAQDESAPFIGNTRTKIFHRSDCRIIFRPNREDKFAIPKNLRIFFQTREDAEGRGYKPCKICNP